MEISRRRRNVLGIGGSVLVGGLAGCLGFGDSRKMADGDTENSNMDSRDSPEVATSFTVLGDFATGVAGDVARVNTLVPTGQHGHGWSPNPKIQRDVLDSDLFVYVADGFQPWADDIVTNSNTGDTGVSVVAAREGIDLLAIDSSHEHGHDHDHDHDQKHTTKEESDRHESHTHSHTNTPAHARGSTDPHFWLDPGRSKQAVETIREAFTTIDEDNAEAYAENAAAYTHRLDKLDEKFASALGQAPNDVVLVAGHNAFQYLGSRYGFEIEALTGISPDDQPTPKDIAHAQEIITTYDIGHILAPSLESNRAATQLVNQTDAKEFLPITSIAGMKKEWQEKNWGYIDLMETINLPSLKRALGAQ